MTTIAYRNGTLAADSQVTYEGDASGHRKHRCEAKMFRKMLVTGEEVIIATQGECEPAMLFVKWFDGSDKDAPEALTHNIPDFTCLVLRASGLWEYGPYCVGEKVAEEFYAVGSGCKAALGAMHMGASARRAVQIACEVDPYTMGPVHTMRL
jgi:ATP-dependent protease HslVU (ClpYQ) peptidase subunit